MTEHSPQTPPFPNGSIDLNALHDAAIAGELGATMPESVMLNVEVSYDEMPVATVESVAPPAPVVEIYAAPVPIAHADYDAA